MLFVESLYHQAIMNSLEFYPEAKILTFNLVIFTSLLKFCFNVDFCFYIYHSTILHIGNDIITNLN